MNINILRYSLFGIAGGQEIDRNFFFKFLTILLETWIFVFFLRGFP